MCVAQMDGWARFEGFWGAPRAGNIVALVGRAGRVDSSHPQDRDSGASLPADRPEGGVWGAVNRIRVRRAGRAGGGAKRGRRVPLRRRHPANRNAPSAELHGCCRCARERGLSPTRCPPDGQTCGHGRDGRHVEGGEGEAEVGGAPRQPHRKGQGTSSLPACPSRVPSPRRRRVHRHAGRRGEVQPRACR